MILKVSIDFLDGKNRIDTQLAIFIYQDEIDEMKEYFEELQSNGANPEVEKITFKEYIRPLSNLSEKELEEEDNKRPHFLDGFIESIGQSDKYSGFFGMMNMDARFSVDEEFDASVYKMKTWQDYINSER